ncbi:MAG: radical SAM protein [Candidatus Eisenbacteria bacterium]|uniref:Radical SAM protein n=1 Tax=Eiseniibacteriota bacterium TaxID=2212470 RepID=A0A937X925_UNCEI|nr:radical SAM protein [Candidatus Eisenbacteria bacterium]
MSHPAFLDLTASGELEARTGQALARLGACDLCPRLCRADRLGGEFGFCATGRQAKLASAGPHFGEEDVLVGRRGSGTIFVASCNLGCDFCQNAEISRERVGREVTASEWAQVMLELQARGCHNINIVTPSHVVPALLEALCVAARGGLRLPIVYNTSAYDLPETLRLLAGVIDIYMPDFKFWDPQVSGRYAGAPDYAERAREALREMHRQTGDLVLDAEGLARRGLLARHLVLPEGLAGTRPVCEFLAREISHDTYINVMDQYQPARDIPAGDPLARRITRDEYAAAVEQAREAGLHRFAERRPLV